MSTARKRPCRKKEHSWTLGSGRRCAICGARRTRMPGTPSLVRLAYGSVYCELCRTGISAGEPVAWWRVAGSLTRASRPAAYCSDCHRANLKQGRALR